MPELTHAALVPLIGGMTIGVSVALSKPPTFIASYPAFRKNDAHVLDYYPDVPFFDLDVPYWHKRLSKFPEASRPDIITTVCPCAGLSITSSRSSNHGAASTHNRWMYLTAEFALSNLKPKVFFGENAPALFGLKGEPVARRLADIGKKYGYSFSMVFTNTILHGVPQNRPRCFYFLWAAPKAPKFKAMKRPDINIAEFMRQVKYPKDDTIDRIEYCRVPLLDDIYYQYAVEKWGDAWRAECDGRTIIDQLKKNGELLDFFHWAKANASDHIQFEEIERHENLVVKQSRNAWDASPKVVSKSAPAVMFKNYKRIVHPFENRFLNVRELMSLMGFPADFKLHLDDEKQPDTALEEAIKHVSQNVPCNTATDMALYVKNVLSNKIPLSDTEYYMYDNTRQMRVLQAATSRADQEMEEDDDDDSE